MQTYLEPIAPKVDWHGPSFVTEVVCTGSGLRIVAAASQGVGRFVEIHFPFVRAFQVMDEGDMLAFWEAPRSKSHMIYKVISGGWRARVAGQFLHVTAALDNMYEWLIVSDSLCVSVISAFMPHIREYSDAA